MKNIKKLSIIALVFMTVNFDFLQASSQACTFTNNTGYPVMIGAKSSIGYSSIPVTSNSSSSAVNSNGYPVNLSINLPKFSTNLIEGTINYSSSGLSISAAKTPGSFTNNTPFTLRISSASMLSNSLQPILIVPQQTLIVASATTFTPTDIDAANNFFDITNKSSSTIILNKNGGIDLQ